MVKIKKYQIIDILKYCKEKYKSIDELIEDINKNLENDDDIAISIKEYN